MAKRLAALIKAKKRIEELETNLAVQHKKVFMFDAIIDAIRDPVTAELKDELKDIIEDEINVALDTLRIER